MRGLQILPTTVGRRELVSGYILRGRCTNVNLHMQQNKCADVVINGKRYNSFTEPAALIAQERAKTSFPVRELTHFYNNGEAETQKSEEFMEILERDPAFENNDFYDWDYEQLREITFKQVTRVHAYLYRALGTDMISARQLLSPIGYINPSAATRLSVHTGLFMNAIGTNGTDKQYKYWVERGMASLHKFYGCFGMTELGHGSNVSGLETTATYDPQTEEFIIHTPTTAATKWWIGGAAHSANHTVALARLIVDGKDYGVQNFVVQLRSTKDHSILPGIALGDIGKKMGRDGIDNGWIQFTNVRIPRTNMLQRYCKVSSDGKVEVPPLAQLAYGTLISGRVSMAYDSYIWGRRFLTIAIRYAAARRQFSSSPNEPETILLDYPYHQRRLMPLLARTIAIEAASTELCNMYIDIQTKQRTIDLKDPKAVAFVVKSSKELFGLSAGLKAFSTWACCEIIDECRQACGGHGYSGYNGFGQAYADWVVNCTWEGDNNVLSLSAGRSLIQSGLKLLKGQEVSGPQAYLNNFKQLTGAKLNGRSLKDPKVAVEAWQSVAANVVIEATKKFVELTKSGKSPTQAFEALSSYRFLCGRIHTISFQVRALYQKIETQASPAIKDVLHRVATLFTASSIAKDGALFLQYGYITSAEFEEIESLVNEYCALVREQAIGITDAFNLSDYYINAPIGNYNGDVYNNYFKKVRAQKPSKDGVAPYLDKQMAFFKRQEDDFEPLDEV